MKIFFIFLFFSFFCSVLCQPQSCSLLELSANLTEPTISVQSLSETLLAVGYPFINNGLVVVYEYNNISNTYNAVFSVYGENPGDNFGYAVSINSNTGNLFIGAPTSNSNAGSLYQYQYSNVQWARVNYWKGQSNYMLGYSLSLSDSMVIVGAPGANTYTGKVLIFTEGSVSGIITPPVWSLSQVLIGNIDSGNFGYSVSISNSGQVMGISQPFGSDLGYVYLYFYDSSTKKFELFQTFNSGQSSPTFGYSISVWGNPGNNKVGIIIGFPSVSMVQISDGYSSSNTSLQSTQQIFGPASSAFGSSVSADRVYNGGHTLISVGDPVSSQVSLIDKSRGSWQVVKSQTSNSLSFGISVSTSKGTVSIGDYSGLTTLWCTGI